MDAVTHDGSGPHSLTRHVPLALQCQDLTHSSGHGHQLCGSCKNTTWTSCWEDPWVWWGDILRLRCWANLIFNPNLVSNSSLLIHSRCSQLLLQETSSHQVPTRRWHSWWICHCFDCEAFHSKYDHYSAQCYDGMATAVGDTNALPWSSEGSESTTGCGSYELHAFGSPQGKDRMNPHPHIWVVQSKVCKIVSLSWKSILREWQIVSAMQIDLIWVLNSDWGYQSWEASSKWPDPQGRANKWSICRACNRWKIHRQDSSGGEQTEPSVESNLLDACAGVKCQL